MMPAMSITIAVPPETPENGRKKKAVNVASRKSPLARELKDFHAQWLLTHVSERWSTLHNNMGSWRCKMEKWERMSEEDYSDRRHAVDPVNASSVRDIFTDQNDTLGTVAGFVDFHEAQSRDDIFGTRPWLAATPEGRDDNELAEIMTKHAQWKFNQGDLEDALIDALRISTWGGTAFIKPVWDNDVDVFTRRVPVAHDVATGQPILSAAGDYVRTAEELAEMGITEEMMEWQEIEIEETEIISRNVSASCLDFKDIAFETTAKSLDLKHTDVFCRFRMGFLDVMERYQIPEERRNDLMGTVLGISEEARDHRDETDPSGPLGTNEQNANPTVTLVEGFVRCDPLGKGRASRIHVIFSPDLNILFAVDYLSNITPGGILPVFPVRIFKIPNRVFGKGYFEKYENPNNAIDRQYNVVTYRNRNGAHIHTAFQPEALKDGGEDREILLDPHTPYVLAPDKSITDLIGFAVAPDNNNTAITLLNQTMQMIQMRSGITSAAQGELKGVPSASTATGTNQLTSRGATIIKDPIDTQTNDIRRIVEYSTILLYANQDRDETFTWGEGKATSLLTIKAGDVQGIRANVTLTLVQAQNQQKLQSAMTAIDVVTKYIQVPEPDKVAARRAFVQALSAIGFNDADSIIRAAAVDPMGILALCPPEIAPLVQQAFEQAGLIAPPAAPGEQSPAPVSAPAQG
ncbi:MAG: hypothetical protein RLZZ214_4342 [Verrucomicrobiota bacterium]|jgi:hypothetical protein